MVFVKAAIHLWSKSGKVSYANEKKNVKNLNEVQYILAALLTAFLKWKALKMEM